MISVFGGVSLVGGIILVCICGDWVSIGYIIEDVGDIESSRFFMLGMIFVVIGGFSK